MKSERRKIGCRVRVKSGTAQESRNYAGEYGCVIKECENTSGIGIDGIPFYYMVKLETCAKDIGIWASDMEVVEVGGKYKRGDVVQVIKRNRDNTTGSIDNTKGNGDVGRIGVVEDISSGTNPYYTLMLLDKDTNKNGSDYIGMFYKEEIRPYSQAKHLFLPQDFTKSLRGMEFSSVIIDEVIKTKDMNIIETFKMAIMGEPAKTFIKTGITESDGELTEGGQELFLQWLLVKHGEEFKTDVVDKIVSEQKANKDNQV